MIIEKDIIGTTEIIGITIDIIEMEEMIIVKIIMAITTDLTTILTTTINDHQMQKELKKI